MKFWKTKVKDNENIEKIDKNDDILVTIEDYKCPFRKIFSETYQLAVNKTYGKIEFSISPFVNGAFSIIGNCCYYCYARTVIPESYELKNIENNIRKTIIEIIKEFDTDQSCKKIRNVMFEKIKNDLKMYHEEI